MPGTGRSAQRWRWAAIPNHLLPGRFGATLGGMRGKLQAIVVLAIAACGETSAEELTRTEPDRRAFAASIQAELAAGTTVTAKGPYGVYLTVEGDACDAARGMLTREVKDNLYRLRFQLFECIANGLVVMRESIP